MSIQNQIEEIKKHISDPNIPPEILFEMNRKYRELETIYNYKLEKVFYFN